MSSLKEKILLPFNFILFLLTLSFFINYMLGLIVLLIPLEFLTRKRSCYPKVINFFKFLTFHLIRSTFVFYINEPISVMYDETLKDFKGGIVISNHLTNFDWWFYLVFMNHLGKAYDISFIAKDELSRIPIISRVLKIFGVIFVKRTSETKSRTNVIEITQPSLPVNPSLEKLTEDLQKRAKINPNTISFIFPEGTVLNGDSIRSSKKYVKDKNMRLENGELFPVKNVLCPRSSGFRQIIEASAGKIRQVMDCTLVSSYKNEKNEDGKHLFDAASFTDIFIKRKFKLSMNIIAEKEDISFLQGISDIEEHRKAYKTFLLEKFARKNKIISEMNNSESNNTFNQIWDTFYMEREEKFVLERILMYNFWNMLFFLWFNFLFFVIIIGFLVWLFLIKVFLH